MRLNIETLSELRNEATHYVIPFIPPDVMGIFQATVLNYTHKLQEWFSLSVSQRTPVGMMALIYEFDPSEYSLGNPRIRRRLTAEAAKWLTEFQENMRVRATGVGDRENEFIIRVDYRLAFVKKPNFADIVLGTGGGEIQGTIIERTKDIDNSHPKFLSHVLDEVNSKLTGNVPAVNEFDVRVVRKVHNIPTKGDFVQQPSLRGGRTQYSPLFVDWLVAQSKKDLEFFEKAREKNRQQKL